MSIHTPETMRAQVQKCRAMSQEKKNYDLFSLECGIACGMLEVAAEQIESIGAYSVKVQAELATLKETHQRVGVAQCKAEARYLEQVKELKKENDFLRALVGTSDKACVYCGLGAEDQFKCASGFPGCARADDQMLCRNFGDAAALHDAMEEIKKLTALVERQRQVIDTHSMMAETAPNPDVPESVRLK